LIFFISEPPVSDLVSLSASRFHQSVDCRRLVLGSEMGVPHDHLERPVPEQRCNVRKSTPAITSLLAKV
jgi:hypothetical protein